MTTRVMLIEERCKSLSSCKEQLAISLEELAAIESRLATQWQVDFVETRGGVRDSLHALPLGPARTTALAAYDADEQALRRGANASGMYAAMALPEICGVVTSSRRHYLLDSVALACALYRTLGCAGRILDVGCHVGIAPDLLARTLGCAVVGLEPDAQAVAA